MLGKRFRYFGAKVRRAWADGALREKAGRFLVSSLRIPLEATCGYVRLPGPDRRLDVAAGFADHRGQAGHHRSDPVHLRRIVGAYKASKQAQRSAPAAFEIRGEWSAWIDVNFKDLIRALDAEDVPRLAALLENLHREQFALGAGSSYDEYVRCRTSLTGPLYVRTVWCRYRDLFRAAVPSDVGIHYPLLGNPAGIPLDGDVISIQTFRHAYHAWEMLGWLRDVRKPVIVEIGGGVGGQAYQVMRVAGAALGKYVVFDIPEMASVCSYVLLSAFPEKRIRLFGEGPVSVSASEEYDIAVLPHFEITHLADGSVDLFHNACSFSEMDRASSTEYLRIIERTCRRYFAHINHETRFTRRNADGSMSVNAIGSELVPDPQRFRRVFRKPRTFRLPEDRSHAIFEYLYERVDR